MADNVKVEKAAKMITSSGFPQYTSDFNWKFYKSLVENYFALNSVADLDQQKELFITYLPDELFDLLFALIGLENLRQASIADLFDQLTTYFDIEMNVHRRNFYRRDQGELETASDFAKGLRFLAEKSFFGGEANALLCHYFVSGLNEEQLKLKLKNYKGQTFDSLVRRATTLEFAVVRDARGGGDGVDENMVTCCFKDSGCEFKGLPELMEKHVTAFNAKHLLLLQEKQKDLFQLNATRAQQIESQKQQIDVLLQLSDGQKQLIGAQRLEFDAHGQEFRGQKKQCDLLMQELSLLKKPDFVWFIQRVSDKMQNAETNSGYRIVSAAFYTQNGYCMEASLQCCSGIFGFIEKLVFCIRLLPGIYDTSLRWPLYEVLKVTLHDQLDGTRDRCSRLEFSKWNCLAAKRPLEASGWFTDPYFTIFLKELKTYVKDDELLITVAMGKNEFRG